MRSPAGAGIETEAVPHFGPPKWPSREVDVAPAANRSFVEPPVVGANGAKVWNRRYPATLMCSRRRTAFQPLRTDFLTIQDGPPSTVLGHSQNRPQGPYWSGHFRPAM
jgi:hypothetical protein